MVNKTPELKITLTSKLIRNFSNQLGIFSNIVANNMYKEYGTDDDLRQIVANNMYKEYRTDDYLRQTATIVYKIKVLKQSLGYLADSIDDNIKEKEDDSN